MVRVTFKPWEEVIIHEPIYYSFEDIVKFVSLGVQPGGLAQPLQWAEGIVFLFHPMPPTDEVIKEQLEGKIHWNSVSWALMPKCQDFIPIKDINAKIPIVDVSAKFGALRSSQSFEGASQELDLANDQSRTLRFVFS